MHPELDSEKIKKMEQSKDESKSSLSKLWSSFKSGFKQMRSYVFGENVKEVPSLSVYLDDHFKLLAGKISLSGTDPNEVIKEIVYIYQSLYKYYLHYDGMSHLVQKDGIKKVGICTQC